MVKNLHEVDMLKEIDKRFRRFYGMDFNEFERVLRMLIEHGFQYHKDFDRLMQDYIVWKEAIDSLKRAKRKRRWRLHYY